MIQEVTSKKHIEVMGYHTIENIGTAGRVTAMIIREDLQMDRIKRIPSERGIMAYYKNMSHQYTGCPRRNVPDFGRVFLMLKYTDITQNTYVQSVTFTEIMAREKLVFLRVHVLYLSADNLISFGLECSFM